MKLFVTGGAGFIGSNYVRHVLADTDDEVTVYDALTYAGNLSTLPTSTPTRATLREGRHLRPRRRARSHARPRRRRALRGREPRRPVDRRPRRVRQHELLRHQHRHATSARRLGRRALRPHRHRRGVRLDRGGLVQGDRPARAPLAVLRIKGRLRPDRALLPPHLRAAGHGHPVARTTSGRTSSRRRSIPLFATNLLEGPDPALRRRAQRARLDATSTTTAPASPGPARGRARRDLQHRRRQRDTNRVLVDKLLGLARRRRGAGRRTSRTASATTAATRSTSPRSPSSGGSRAAHAGRGARGDRRVVPRQRLVVANPSKYQAS